MKKIIVSAVVAAMALSTTASALEDIKVSGQAKLWYETSDTNKKDIFSNDGSTGEVAFKLGMTGKQGNVGFGTTVYQTSTMGLEGTLVSNTRTDDTNLQGDGELFVGEAYITAPLIASTIMKFGKQELNTPLAFTETWNATPNTFNAAVLVNNSVDNLTLIGAYVGQGNTNNKNFRTNGDVTTQYFGGAYTIGALYKTDAFGINVWGYQVNNVGTTGLGWYTTLAPATQDFSVKALWADAEIKAGIVNIGALAAYVNTDANKPATNPTKIGEATSAFALNADVKAADITFFGAVSTVSEGHMGVGNTATGGKKSKLPTEGVYTDGLYVAMPGSTAGKLKVSTKLGTTGLALQGVMNRNNFDKANRSLVVGSKNRLDTNEVDFIVSQKLGDFDIAAILMNRSFEDKVEDKAKGGNYVRVVTSVNF